MRTSSRRRNDRRIEEDVNVDRWLVSYADFVTLLFAFFVVMYAISSVNEGKYRVLADTFVNEFNTPPKSSKPIQIGDPIEKTSPQDNVNVGIPKPIIADTPTPIDKQQQKLAQIAKDVTASLQTLIDQDLIKVSSNNFWVVIEINASVLFSSGSAELEEEGMIPMIKLAAVLAELPNHIDVEGHTDNLPISTPIYPSNWELSASRSSSVVHLFTKHGIAPNRLAAIGFGEHQPIADNSTIIGRRKNRRVRIVILADKNSRRVAEIEGN